MASSKGKSKRHAHKNKRRDAGHFTPYMSHKLCTQCGKHCYLTREEAKQSAKVNHPGQTMHIYDCTEPNGRVWWHLSSIPAGKLQKLRDREHGKVTPG